MSHNERTACHSEGCVEDVQEERQKMDGRCIRLSRITRALVKLNNSSLKIYSLAV
jgi:hypothetical protein